MLPVVARISFAYPPAGLCTVSCTEDVVLRTTPQFTEYEVAPEFVTTPDRMAWMAAAVVRLNRYVPDTPHAMTLRVDV